MSERQKFFVEENNSNRTCSILNDPVLKNEKYENTERGEVAKDELIPKSASGGHPRFQRPTVQQGRQPAARQIPTINKPQAPHDWSHFKLPLAQALFRRPFSALKSYWPVSTSISSSYPASPGQICSSSVEESRMNQTNS